jgi:heme exporter protein A
LVAHAAMVYPDLTGRENLVLAARLYGIAPDSPGLAELGQRFELGTFMERPARTYSRGQLQRLSLARALVHAPRLLLLDEPSTGLDANGHARLIEAMRHERTRGAIVVLVTHDAGLAESVADRRVTLARGKLAAVAA